MSTPTAMSPLAPPPPSPPPATVGAAQAWAERGGLPRLEAQLLVLHSLGRDPQDRAWLLAHDDAPLDAPQWERLHAAVRARLDTVPMAYLLGEREFHGLRLQVDARVLDPRPDTETLVDWALDLGPQLPPGPILDLGTGSGAIALALAHAWPEAQVWAVDRSPEALALAMSNAQRLGLALHGLVSDWFGQITGDFALVVSNPPYIAESDPHLQALRHEPRQALVSGPQGLDDLQRLIRAAPAHLRDGAWLLLEHGHDQADAVCGLLREAGFAQVQSRTDLAGIRRCSGGCWSALK